ncbi:dienelactone hydrolase family protein [Novosphingobium album (ex Liu et al. 2023)]|uniref:Dienelactone hydrolase family protein n=1 Tax=Novosphingobium album (ex Liu et al. 2023) TaxID=3031130 RepID=A0ABT5WVT0_9SPHN|nr:dienelactone hydrolase family protein [Novosphingobium album (ex Liu et al. 2023)]MDE8653962.1 dienelactone hydrolase family protein [Novosphingobium album (ex Liu et al. 2023)]
MCDDFTESAEAAALARMGLSRREFAALGASAALAGCARMGSGDAGELRERTVEITTADGVADAFFVHPAKGAHPGIIMWPDIAGLREAFKVMARKLAAEGHAVLVVNQYYRGGPAPVMQSFSEYRTPEGQAKIAPLREALTPEAITRDARAFVAFLDGDRAVDAKRRIGSNGYCMGGPFTVRTAAAVPGRVGAAASLHGAGLVTPAPDSPHRMLAATGASYLFAIARNDDARDPASKDELRKAADGAGRPAEIEVYPADHGWCVPDSPSWDPVAADKAWQRMVALFEKL